MVEQFRRYCPDKIGPTDRTADGQADTKTDRAIPIYSWGWGWGVIKKS